jgi:serine/threonine protein kinase
MAPEVIKGAGSYGQRVDIWSVGATVLEMLTGRPPFHHLSPMAALLLVGTTPNIVPDLPDALSEAGSHFLRLCFQ